MQYSLKDGEMFAASVRRVRNLFQFVCVRFEIFDSKVKTMPLYLMSSKPRVPDLK